MALNLKLADAYVDISMRTTDFADDYDWVMNRLKKAPSRLVIVATLSTGMFDRQYASVMARLNAIRNVPIRLTLDRAAGDAALSLFQQHLRTLQRQGRQRIAIQADLRGWNRSIMKVFTDLQRVRLFAATIPIKVNATPAHATINLLIQQLRAAQALTKFQFTATRGPGFSFGGMGGGGGRGGMGGGFLQGLGMGLGMPFTSSPAMMAGDLTGKALVETTRTATDLEAEFAELRRITGMTAEALDGFKQSILQMATSRPGVSTQDLIGIAQIGGRMGVSDREGPAGLAGFVEQLSRVRLAINDIPTEELANRMGRALNVFELGTDRVAGFGSALTALDNVSTASARDILDITTRLSGTAHAVGLTLPQVAALSSVLKDVGASNETAGTAFSQIFRKMATDSEAFAKEIGMDAKAFADAYRKDPMDALGMVIDKFNQMKDTITGQQFLDELGLKGARTSGLLQQLATKFGDVATRTKLAAGETGSLASLTGAEAIMGDTARAKFTTAKNSVVDLADAVGGKLSPLAKGAAAGLSDVASALASIIRGTNRPSMAGGPANAAKAVLAPLAAQGPGPVPLTVADAQKAVDAAKTRAADAEADFDRQAADAKRLGFDARQAMAGAAGKGPGEVNAALALGAKAAQAEDAATKAGKAMEAAGDALRQAMLVLADREREQAAKDDMAKAANDQSNLIFQAKSRLGNLIAAGMEGRQALLGLGGRALGSVAAAVAPATEQRRTFAAGLSGEDVGQRIQEDILNMGKEKDTEQIASNTAKANDLLGELRDILKRTAGQAQAAVLGQ